MAMLLLVLVEDLNVDLIVFHHTLLQYCNYCSHSSGNRLTGFRFLQGKVNSDKH